MKAAIVITTIFENTAIEHFDKICQDRGWKLIVIGDKKTPNLSVNGYYSVEQQKKEFRNSKLFDLTPFNSYIRKNLGYILAWRSGADYIFSLDDDNYPINEKSLDIMLSAFAEKTLYKNKITSKSGNFLKLFNTTDRRIWPRGIPFQYIDELKYDDCGMCNPFVVASLWNGSPDFDVIGHVLHDDIDWNFKEDVSLFSNQSMMPYNTQATVFVREVLPYQLMFPNVGRMCDILTGYISQYVMLNKFKTTGVKYIGPQIKQIRNEHDYYKDFRDEIYTLINADRIVSKLLESPVSLTDGNEIFSYAIEVLKDILPNGSKEYVEAWKEELHGHS